MVTPRQLTAIHAALTSRGVTSRSHRRAIVSRIIDQPIESTKDIMRDEAGRVLDYLGTFVTVAEFAEFANSCVPTGSVPQP
jgi:hypothetical protein